MCDIEEWIFYENMLIEIFNIKSESTINKLNSDNKIPAKWKEDKRYSNTFFVAFWEPIPLTCKTCIKYLSSLIIPILLWTIIVTLASNSIQLLLSQ